MQEAQVQSLFRELISQMSWGKKKKKSRSSYSSTKIQTNKRSDGLTKWPDEWITKDIKVKPYNRQDSPDISPRINGQMISTKVPGICNGKRVVSSTNGAGKLDIHMQKEWNWSPNLHHTQKSTQNEWRLTHTTQNHRTPIRKHRGKLYDIGLGNDFLDMTPKTQPQKQK